jgi:pimeloyl-ACP methyl ester carboxylesterase
MKDDWLLPGIDEGEAGRRAEREHDRPTGQDIDLALAPPSEGIEIRGGGAVAVDTDSLRSAAGRFVLAGIELESVRERLGSLQNMLGVQREHAWDAVSSASVLSAKILEVQGEADQIAAALREAAAVYELVELNAAHTTAILSGDHERAALLDARRNRLASDYPDARLVALGAEFERTVMWPSDLVRQSTETGFFTGEEFGAPVAVIAGASAGLVTIGGAVAAGSVGLGRVARDARLSGVAPAVTVTPVTAHATATPAPVSLVDATSRIPGAGDSRVRVEGYTMRDGTKQFAVYVAGTQSLAVGGEEAWDNQSNVELYTGSRSASYEATVQALEAAGVRPSDVVHAFGHSQGSMVTAHLALESGYDVRTHVALGSPVEGAFGDGTLSVGLRHTDDPVAALAGGGYSGSVGAPGSFVVEREVDPSAGLHDTRVTSHRLNAYGETAALVDASTDPRVDAVREVFRELSGAVSVEVTEYAATRGPAAVSPSRGGGG